MTISKILDPTYSEFYVNQFRTLLLSDDPVVEDFLNRFFNNLNLYATELFVAIRETKDQPDNTLLKKKTRSLNIITIHLLRLLEVMTQIAPELFIKKSKVNESRILNFIYFSLQSLFTSGIEQLIDNFADQNEAYVDKVVFFLAPFLGILCNLKGVKAEGDFKGFLHILCKADGFTGKLLGKLKELVE